VKKPAERTRIQSELLKEAAVMNIPFWSSAVWRIMAFIGVPFVIALAVASGLSSSTVRHNVNDWLSPIRDTLTNEERATLPTRLDAAAQTLAFVFRRHENSLLSYKNLVERT